MRAHEFESQDLPSVERARQAIPQILARAQRDYDAWDETDRDTYAGGGICHIIADSVCDVLSDAGIECTSVSCSHEQHVYVAARFSEGVYTIDIPYHIYEQGGGFSWKKLPDVRFEPRDVVFYRVSGDPADWRDYLDEGMRDVVNFVRNIGSERDAPIVMMTNPQNTGARTASGQRMRIEDFPLKTVAVSELRPWEPMIKMRDLPSQRTVASLIKTLQQGGRIPPLLVTPVRGGYRIIDGHHRYAALQRAGIEQAPVRVVDPRLIRYSDEIMEALKITLERYGHLGALGMTEGKVIHTYLWHGSRQKIPMLEPRQAVDTGGAVGSNQNAIYATSDPIFAIQMGMPAAGSDYGHFPNDPQMVLFSGKIRKGEYVYLHKLPFNGPDGKPQFVQGGNSREFHSVPGVKGIEPTEIKAVPVNKYLNLIRKATREDWALRKKFMKKQGVAEGRISDLDIDLQDQQWDSVVGRVQHGVRRGEDPDGMSLALYRWAAGEMFDMDEELERRGFRSVADLADHIRDHGGRYVPPEFDLGAAGSIKDIQRLPRRRPDDVSENFADGKIKGKSRPGRVERAGASCKGSVTDLRARAQKYGGERGKMYHWCANMKSGRKK